MLPHVNLDPSLPGSCTVDEKGSLLYVGLTTYKPVDRKDLPPVPDKLVTEASQRQVARMWVFDLKRSRCGTATVLGGGGGRRLRRACGCSASSAAGAGSCGVVRF